MAARRERGDRALTEDDAWSILRGLSALASGRARNEATREIDVAADGMITRSGEAVGVGVDVEAERGWTRRGGEVTREAAELLDLYLPLCVGPKRASIVVGHLGQSLDGRIATDSGSSQFITGQENLKHTHRMRALFDAIVVGSRTVEEDDPRLTTRMVAGDNPTRIIIDPRRRLGAEYSVFRDEAAPTLVFCRASAAPESLRLGAAEIVPIDDGGRDSLRALDVVGALRRRGLGRIFIEGGGRTVSSFLAEGALDRLHVAVAPVILGSGRPAFSLPEIDVLDQAMRFRCRHFGSGPDILFDCDLRG